MHFSLLICLVLASAPPTLPVNETSEMLSFIAAQQQSTAAIYDTLSYTAVVKSATMEDFSPDPFQQTVVYKFSKRGKSILLTREASNFVEEQEQRENGKLVGSKFKVHEVPTAKRLLFTEKFKLLWSDVATPRLDLYNASDWKTTDEDYKQNLRAYMQGAELKHCCFGQANPFYELLPLSQKFCTWELSKIDDGEFEIKRMLTSDPEKIIQDLTMNVSAEAGLMRKALCRPGKNGWESTCEVEYASMPYKTGVLEVPKHYHSKDVENGNTLVQEIDISFTDFRDESDMPDYSLGDIGLPEGAEVWRILSPEGVQYLQWKGGELVGLSAPAIR